MRKFRSDTDIIRMKRKTKRGDLCKYYIVTDRDPKCIENS